MLPKWLIGIGDKEEADAAASFQKKENYRERW